MLHHFKVGRRIADRLEGVFAALMTSIALLASGSAWAQPTVPLYTWFSATRGDHFTTSDPAWAGTVGTVRPSSEGSGYVLVRVEGAVLSPAMPQPAGTVPIYSFWNPALSDNFLTSNPEWVSKTANSGYTRFRLEGYVYSNARPDTLPLRSFWSQTRGDNYASSDPRLNVPQNASAGELTMSVEGGRYLHYRLEGHLLAAGASAAPARPAALNGLVDLHAHLMSHLAFGKRLVHGAPDASVDPVTRQPNGSLLPAGTRDCNAQDMRAATIEQALGHDNSTHGGRDEFNNRCGDYQREVVLGKLGNRDGAHSEHGADKGGWPTFAHWPRHNDTTHQQMWVDWIRRAHSQGMRVMVALAVNSSGLGGLLHGTGPLDDKSSADLQIAEIRSFVARHADFMEIASSPTDLRRIVAGRKLAVVLGLELDNLGNFSNVPPAQITRAAIAAEVNRLYAQGVRYVFPVHATNNRFAGAAAYEVAFTILNKIQTGGWPDFECSPTVGWRHDAGSDLWQVFMGLSGSTDRPRIPACPSGQGQRNMLGLTSPGRDLIDELMRRGMLVDIDHMSERAVDDTIKIASSFPSGWGYPLIAGHNGPRGQGGEERNIRSDQIEALRNGGGMLGLGWSDTTAPVWRGRFKAVRELIGDGRIALGTDMNGVEKQPGPPASTQVTTTWSTGTRIWNYRTDGVAQYGMIPEFVQDVQFIDATEPSVPGVAQSLARAAEGFARTWERATESSRRVLPAGTLGANVVEFTPPATPGMCPKQLVAGDREFGGHGPEIWASVELQPRADGGLDAVANMRAQETQHDWSEARGTWRFQVSPPGMRIAEVLSDRRSDIHYISSPAGAQFLGGTVPNSASPPPITGNLVRTWDVVGDTGGEADSKLKCNTANEINSLSRWDSSIQT